MISSRLKTKVLAASFKTVDQVYRVSMSGAHSATVTPDMQMQLVKHPMTDISVNTKSPDPADRKRHLKRMIAEARQYYRDFPEFYQYYR
jgi:transaldolase